MDDFGLYAIMTNPRVGHLRFTEIAVEEEIPFLQLREKNLSDRELYQLADSIKPILAGSKTRLVINDRLDIAMACDAQGLHLGQDDLPPRAAAPLWYGRNGHCRLLGLSTHSLSQAREALAWRPDYIGFGPIHPTPTKEIPDPEVGLSFTAQVLAMANHPDGDSIPVVFLGGLFPENIEELIEAGARNIALVRYFMESSKPRERIQEIKSLLSKANQSIAAGRKG